MSYLLDTHSLLWFWMSPEKLSKRIKDILADDDVLVSHCNIWEIALKFEKGKLLLPIKASKEIINYVQDNDFELLPIETDHILKSVALPNHHADPFDRLLIAQAVTEGLILITDDAHIQKYDVKTIQATR